MYSNDNLNWKGDISNNPYPKEFTVQLKLKIRERERWTNYFKI